AVLENETVKRLTSRKFWALNAIILTTFVCVWRILDELSDLVEGDHIGEKVFENLYGMTITTAAIFLAVMVAWYFGVNALQHVKLAQIGIGK
ncbi:MAG: hypothetical protein DRH30_14270, partial [Deltaproteobacteria bacterium]